MFEKILQEAKTNAERANSANDDYLGEDGLMHCAKCGGAKQCRVEINGVMQKVYCQCECGVAEYKKKQDAEKAKQKAEMVKELRVKSLMDDKFQDATFENFKVNSQNEKAYKVGKYYADNFKEMCKENQGLLFYGNVGTGKTYLACCIANAIMDKGRSVYITSIVRMLHERNNFSDYFSKDNEGAEMIKNVDLLIVDDLDAERHTDYAAEVVCSVIDTRYRANKPMIITTNMDVAAMKDAANVQERRVYDRIKETCYPVQFSGKSFRQSEAKRRFKKMNEVANDEK